jgi:hypothetical protein
VTLNVGWDWGWTDHETTPKLSKWLSLMTSLEPAGIGGVEVDVVGLLLFRALLVVVGGLHRDEIERNNIWM